MADFFPNVIIRGQRMTDAQLEAMEFEDLRRAMLIEWISCSGISTKDELVARYKAEIGKDKSELPLKNERTFSPFDARPKRMGLMWCFRKGCYNTEDGYTAFKVCMVCKC